MKLVPRHRLYVDRLHGHQLLPLRKSLGASEDFPSWVEDEPGASIGRIWIFRECSDATTGDWGCKYEAFGDMDSAIDRYETIAKQIYNNLLEMHQSTNAQGQKKFHGDSELWNHLKVAAKAIAKGEISEAIYEMTDYQISHVGESVLVDIFETDIYP